MFESQIVLNLRRIMIASSKVNIASVTHCCTSVYSIFRVSKRHVNGKVTSVTRTAGSIKPDLEFQYDAMGNRTVKIVKPRTINGASDESKWEYSYYVRDASGNVMAIYSKKYTSVGNSFYTEKYTLLEQDIYGSSRLGTYTPVDNVIASRDVYGTIDATTKKINISNVYNLSNKTKDATNLALYTGHKSYELSNHLGNVLAVVSDRIIPISSNATTVEEFDADVVSASDFTPFGMAMSSRKYSTPSYRYSFNTQEKTEELGEGHTTALYWEYDGKLGRRWNVDPVIKMYESPYTTFSNNPIIFVDWMGADTLDITKTDGKWGISSTKIVSGDDVFRVNDGTETKTYTFSEGEYGKRLSVLNLENDASYTLGVYHVSGKDSEGASGFAITPGGEASTAVGSGKRLPDDTYTLAGTGDGTNQSLFKWVQPLVSSGETGGDVSGRGVKIHPVASAAVETEVGQWTEGCYVVCTEYIKNGTELKYNCELSKKTSKLINQMLGSTTDYDSTGKKSRPGSDFGNGMNFKLIQKTAF